MSERRWMCLDCERTFSGPGRKHTAPGYSVATRCDPGPNGYVPYVPAADYDALAKRVEDMEAFQLRQSIEIVALANEKLAALKVVEAAREMLRANKHELDYTCMRAKNLRDALDAFDKGREG